MVEFAQFLSHRQYSVELLPLTTTDDLESKRAIFLVEIDQPLFTNVTNKEWNCVKKQILTASSSLWVTRGSLAAGKHPEYALITGLASALRTESKSTKFLTVDIEVDADNSRLETFEDLMKLEELADKHHSDRDTEFRTKGGLVHVSRLTADEELNNAAAQRAEQCLAAPEPRPAANLEQVEFRLSLEKPGAPETVHFEEVQPLVEKLEDDSCEIRVQSLRLGQMVRFLTWRHRNITDSLTASRLGLGWPFPSSEGRRVLWHYPTCRGSCHVLDARRRRLWDCVWTSRQCRAGEGSVFAQAVFRRQLGRRRSACCICYRGCHFNLDI